MPRLVGGIKLQPVLGSRSKHRTHLSRAGYGGVTEGQGLLELASGDKINHTEGRGFEKIHALSL